VEFYCRALEFYCRVFLIIFKKGVLIILCLWSSTVAYKEIVLNYLKYWGSIVGGVQSSTVAITADCPPIRQVARVSS
jgi:hypothetical protein